MQVLQWMEDAGVKPSYGMFRDILSFAKKSGGMEYEAIIQERVGKHMTYFLLQNHIIVAL